MPLLRAASPNAPPPDPRLAPDEVVRLLAPYLSAARKRRIEQVLRKRLISVTVVLENLYDPHNGAAVLRSCEAMGLSHLHVVETDEPFFFAPKVSQNAHKWLSIYLYPSIDACIDRLGRWGFQCWAAVPPARGPGRGHAGPPVDAISPLALVFGNEHMGLSRRALELCSRRFSIPLQGFGESLNLSVSAAVTLNRVVESRRAQLAERSEIFGEALARLRAGYYALSVRHAADIIIGELRRIA